MARKIKSFSTPTTAKAEGIEFELDGEAFEAYGEVPGAVLLDFISASDSDSNGKSAASILDYLNKSLNEENFKRFDKIIRDPERPIKIELLAEIVTYLIEERTSRNTVASSQ